MRKCGVQGDHRLLNVAAGAGRARRSFRCPAAGRFATSGGKCPQGTRFPSRLRALAALWKMLRHKALGHRGEAAGLRAAGPKAQSDPQA